MGVFYLSKYITLAHGSGGKLTGELIDNLFIKNFSNDCIVDKEDAAKISFGSECMAFTTDSFVITPIFFNGGDIGKLSICGTVNDLLTRGAEPKVLSCSFIIEEALEYDDLEKIVKSMSAISNMSNVKIVTGDTKVVQKGACDRLFINTTGIGIIPEGIEISSKNAEPGDSIIVTGTVGDHGAAVLVQRENLNIKSSLKSDCNPLNSVVKSVLSVTNNIHVLRDPTRGGIATALNEIACNSNVGILLDENKIPIKDDVRGVCEILGMDPLYMANEGKMLIVVPKVYENYVIEALKKNDLSVDSSVIGYVTKENQKKVLMNTLVGGKRIIDVMTGDQLPRIC
jgi:hydrogenase expression/formation protein HypE